MRLFLATFMAYVVYQDRINAWCRFLFRFLSLSLFLMVLSWTWITPSSELTHGVFYSPRSVVPLEDSWHMSVLGVAQKLTKDIVSHPTNAKQAYLCASWTEIYPKGLPCPDEPFGRLTERLLSTLSKDFSLGQGVFWDATRLHSPSSVLWLLEHTGSQVVSLHSDNQFINDMESFVHWLDKERQSKWTGVVVPPMTKDLSVVLSQRQEPPRLILIDDDFSQKGGPSLTSLMDYTEKLDSNRPVFLILGNISSLVKWKLDPTVPRFLLASTTQKDAEGLLLFPSLDHLTRKERRDRVF